MKRYLSLVLVAASLSACVSMPNGPRVAVMPAPGKPFEVFQQEDFECRQFAQNSVGTTADDSAVKSTAGTAVVGAGVGALAGLLAGNRGSSAATGAAIGAVGGTLIGASNSNITSQDIQHRYDIAYQQCMYAKGNQIPGISRRAVYAPAVAAPPPPAPGYGNMPPPPPPPPAR